MHVDPAANPLFLAESGGSILCGGAEASQPDRVDDFSITWEIPILVGGDWNMTFISPYIGNNHPK